MKRPEMRARVREIFAAVACVGWSIAVGCGGGQAEQTAATQDTSKDNLLSAPVLPDTGPLPPEHEVTAKVEFKTSMGVIVVGLYGKEAPGTAVNFLKYVDSGFYSGKIFHRVIYGFMIQAGGFDAELTRAATEDAIKLEIIPGLKHEPGVLSMARTSNPHSATSQFFVCVGNAPQLNGGYAAFGEVLEGMDVVEAIARVSTQTMETSYGSMADVPSESVVIESARRL